MLEAYGNIWDLAKDYDAIVVTTNGFIKKNGELVMGRGIAKEAKDRYPTMPSVFGGLVSRFGNVPVVAKYDPWWFFTLPVKPAVGSNGEPGWRTKADISLIETSTRGLLHLLSQDSFKDIKSIIMPRPGCGDGGLRWENVKPAIEPLLDDRFTVVTWNPYD